MDLDINTYFKLHLPFVFVATCSDVPRGAGFQFEVLAASNAAELTSEDPTYDFTVFEINRDILPTLVNWHSK